GHDRQAGAAGGPVQRPRKGVGGEDQHAAGEPVLDIAVGGGDGIDEAGTDRLEVEGEAVLHAQLHLHQRGGGREGIVGRGGGNDDEIDVGNGVSGIVKGGARGGHGEVGGELPLRRDMALPDADAPAVAFVGGDGG